MLEVLTKLFGQNLVVARVKELSVDIRLTHLILLTLLVRRLCSRSVHTRDSIRPLQAWSVPPRKTCAFHRHRPSYTLRARDHRLQSLSTRSRHRVALHDAMRAKQYRANPPRYT